MKNYTLAGFSSLLIGWLIASVFYTIAYSIYGYHDDGNHMYPDVTATSVVVIYSLPIAVILHIFAIQLPRFYVKKLFFSASSLEFSLAASLYGLAVFTAIIGWLLLLDSQASAQSKQINLLIFMNAAINGLVFGFAFHKIWKPTEQVD